QACRSRPCPVARQIHHRGHWRGADERSACPASLPRRSLTAASRRTIMSILLLEDRGHVRVMTLNRPDSINSIDMALYSHLIEALAEADQDDNVRAIVLTGAGRGFCSGADTREFQTLTPENE